MRLLPAPALRLSCCLSVYAVIVFGQASSSVSVSVSPNAASYGSAVTLQATVTAGATGKITFYDSVIPVGVASISGGQATLVTTTLASGKRSLWAHYSGDATYGGSNSATVSETVVAGSSLGFHHAVGYSLTGPATSVAVADFNGDGKADLVVATPLTVSVLLGNGDGTFQTAVTYAAGTGAKGVTVGDFNGDGKMDLVVANSVGNVGVLLGNGDGTFQTAVNYSTGSYPNSVVVGDFNGDGKLDLAVSNYSSNSISILLGNGDGTFQAAVNYAVSPGPASLTVGDFNGDGKADLIAATGSGIGVLLGNGDGTFQTATYVTLGNCVSVVVADFNGDGKADVAVSYSVTSNITVLLGKGDGTFQTGVAYPVGYYSTALVVGDFNGDGKADLAAAQLYYATGNNLQMLFGNGDGTFQSPVNYGGMLPFDAVAVGDFNGDGIADLAATPSTNSVVDVLLGGALPDLTISAMHDGGFTQGQIGAEYRLTITNIGDVASSGAVGVTSTIPAGFTATAMAGNGWTCLLATLACTRSDALATGASYPTITINLNVPASLTGDVSASATVSGGGDQSPGNNTATDTAFVRFFTSTTLSGSPNPATLGQAVTLTATVTSGATGHVTFYDGATLLGTAPLNLGQANFGTPLLPSGLRSLRAEYDGDSNYGPSISPILSETVTPVTANGVLPSKSYKVGNDALVALGDFNRDGKPDIVAAYQGNGLTYGGLTVLFGNGDGTFRPGGSYTSSSFYYPNSIVVADFNGDGNPDVAITDTSTGSVYVMLGNGDGTFQAAIKSQPTSPNSYNALISADFNQDGKPDLVALSAGSPTVLLGNGDGTFQAPVSISVSGNYCSAQVVADLNGDGKPDLVCLTTTVNVLLGNGDGTFQAPLSYTATGNLSSPFVLITGDFNGDGKPDVAAVYWVGVAVWLNNGDGTLRSAVTSNVNYVPGYVAIPGDFNGDGKLDIAYVGYVSNQVYLAFGNGDGTFQSSTYGTGTYLSTDSDPTSLAAGDFNGDGRLDLATGNQSGTVNVFLAGQFSGLTISASHASNFIAGKTGTYQISVTNPSFAVVFSTVTVTDRLPSSLTATAISGSGWSCTLATLTCTRSDSLNTNASYPAISVTVNVAGNLTPSVINNEATVSYSGFVNSATDPTTIVLATATTLAISSNPSIFGQPVTLTATVSAGATGEVSFSDGGIMLGTAALSSGQASLSTRLLPAGVQFLTATYSGDATHGPSSSPTKSETVNALQTSGFSALINLPTGTGPVSLASADLNGDGAIDLVTANSSANSVSVLLGNGNGTFRSNVDYAVGTAPIALVIADFNNDGKPELGVLNQSSNNCSILLGNGDGTFRAAVNYATGNGPIAMATGDFNSDGKADLVVANATDDTITVLLGNGDGTFQPSITISNSFATAILVGDFNADGKADIVFASNAWVYLMLGNGDGTFQSSSYASGNGGSLVALAMGDLNGDGKPDLVAADDSTGVSVFLGNGNGTLQSAIHYPSGATPQSVAIADVNGDGRLDVVTANYGGNNISVLFGNGDGTLQSAISYTVGSEPRAVVAGEFNGDGRTDLAVANFQSNSVSVFLGILTPVLALSSSHADPFGVGQTGVSYTITVANDGPGVTSGVVTVADTLPAGLAATAIGGNGWTCTLAILTCTRSDSLAAANSYPSIIITANVVTNIPAQVVNEVSALGGGAPPTNASDITNIVTLPPTVHIDSPASGGSIGGITTISGWAIDNAAVAGTAISSAQVLVDGVAVGSATYGVSRPDVCNAYPGRPGCPNVGFSYQLNTASLGAGQHTITVTATDTDAAPDTGTASVTVTVTAVPPTVHIDGPIAGSVLSGSVAIAGWAVDNASAVGTAISSVQVKVDGTAVGNATYGINRPDVCAAYPGRVGCPNVGFSYLLNLASLNAGPHTITVSATDSDGTPDVGTASVTITVANGPPSIYIDSPTSGTVVSGTVTVSGWALDNTSATGTAINAVQVKVDGAVVGTATYGVARPDVCSAYAGRPGCPNVGFTYALNTSTLSPGPHLLTVSATDSDPSPDTGSWSVTIQIAAPPSVVIDLPAAGSTISGVVTVAGWAIDNVTAVGTAISSVQVKVDGNAVGTATYGAARPDVCAVYAGRPGCPNVGYSYALDTTRLTAGTHTITVLATDSDGTPDMGSATITVTAAAVPPSVHIDWPAAGAAVSGTVMIAGWAIDNVSSVGTGISGVQVRVDGALVGMATYGVSRPDVCTAYAGRVGCPNVGFSYALNTATLTAGAHTITVLATDSDTAPDMGSASVTITVTAVPPSVHIDAPAGGETVSGVVTVAGWAIDNVTAVGTAISSVQVLVDGVAVGTATYGASRPDVCTVYAGRPGCPNVGFSYQWNTATLSTGTHTLTVTATDSDGTPDTGSASITIIR